MPTFDWMHALALVAGAFATALWSRNAPTSPTSPNAKPTPATPAPALTGNPLFDALLKVLEGKLQDLIAVESGPDGSPMFTIRVVLTPEPAATQPTTGAK